MSSLSVSPTTTSGGLAAASAAAAKAAAASASTVIFTMRTLSNAMDILTLICNCPDVLQLLDDSHEGVGDDRGHDQQGEEENDNSGHDELDVLQK